ncbi:MAG: threonine--tRNA ligase [Desulfobacteraceae bacterium]|nr:threonine--tRNA ligase [Desulfobacteraceae bacterium]MCB9494179.1 threonine--tRNA ligase [Desulfobacteraceae bacterium]
MIQIELPDKSVQSYENPPTGYDVALKISEGLASNSVACITDDGIKDINLPILRDTKIKILTPKDEESLEIMRHSAAHVLAEAVLNLYPDAKLTIGPVVKDGFYYDIDMPPVSESDLEKIEQEMKNIIKEKKPFKRQVLSKEDAKKIFSDNEYKIELINELPEDAEISVYEQGIFKDLCRGPHIPHTGMIKAVKLMKVSGAYWRADSSNTQLQRIYGTAFFDKKELNKYLNFLEEAKKRDHRKIGQQLDLFSFHEEGAGMPFFHANGMVLWNQLLEYWRQEHENAGYVETKTPVMLTKDLWIKSGHWENYRENMYTSVIEDYEYAIKPMNCPGGMILFKSRQFSYRDLPYRAGEIGLVHRHEASGVLSGLFRVRAFHQDDAHIFMTPDQIETEILGVLNLIDKMYSTFGLNFHLELSTRPDKSIGSDEQWEMATNGLKSALVKYGKEFKINEGDGAFYGPKIDVHIEDALERTWQCGTVQLDMSLPERFDLSYIGQSNEKLRPIMIHRVIYGSIERFLGILTEHFAGRFPLWLAPVQAVLLPVNDALIPEAEKIMETLRKNKIRVKIDDRSESLKRKVRDAQMSQIPLILTIGEKEINEKTFSVRTLEGKVKMGVNQNEFIEKVKEQIISRALSLDII